MARNSRRRVGERDLLASFPSSTLSGFQVLKNHSPFAAKSRLTRPIACRNATASSMDSLVSATPPGPSIIAAVMSFETMMA